MDCDSVEDEFRPRCMRGRRRRRGRRGGGSTGESAATAQHVTRCAHKQRYRSFGERTSCRTHVKMSSGHQEQAAVSHIEANATEKEEGGTKEMEREVRSYRNRVKHRYEQLFERCQRKKARDQEKLKKLIRREQRIRVMRRILREESSCSSNDEEESRQYEEMCQQWTSSGRDMREDKHYLMHDEIQIEAVDQDQCPQTMFLDVDIRMSNTWTKLGKLARVEPFEIIYRFDGDKMQRVLYSLATGKRVEKEDVPQKVVNGPVLTEEEEIQSTERAETGLVIESSNRVQADVEDHREEQQEARGVESEKVEDETMAVDRRKQMQALEESIQMELEREPLVDTDKQYVEHLKQTGSILRDLLKKENPEKEDKTDSDTKESTVRKRSSRRARRALSYREPSSEDSIEEEVAGTSTPRIISDKKIKKKLKVTVQKICLPLAYKTTLAFDDNSLSPILAAKELEGVMQSSSLQVIPKQLMEEDSPSGESVRAAE